MYILPKKLKLKVTAIVDAALEGLASLTQQDFAAVKPQLSSKLSFKSSSPLSPSSSLK